MPGLLISILATSVIAATPVTPQPWFNFMEDYPMKAFDNRWEGVTGFELLVSPEGQIARCTVTKSSGHEEFDTKTCLLAEKRVRFQPAKNSDGQAVWGVYRSEAHWALPEHKLSGNAGPDLEVSISKLPQGVTRPAAVKLAFAVDAQGQTSQCTVMPTSLRQPQVLVEIGCKELLSRESGKPVIGPSGQPVTAVKTGAVLFKAPN
jgi:TonB family protein